MRVVFTDETSWVRAPQGGILRPGVKLGQAVAEGMEIGRVGDPFGPGGHSVVSSTAGVVIGMTTQTVVDEGDGLFHIAMAKNPEQAERRIKMHQADAIIDEPVDDDPLTD